MHARFRRAGAVLAALALALSASACSTNSALPDLESNTERTVAPSETPQASNDQQDTTGQAEAADDSEVGQVIPGSALEALEQLEVKGRAPKTGYSRDNFGPAWADVDHNGCDTRNDILNRDMTNLTHKANTHDCVVMTGVLDDPYTATRINFQRGQDTSTAVQIDHVVALSDAWQKGAQHLSEASLKALANDPYNLLAVDGPANQQKSDGDAATWLPANTAFRCEYVARQIGVKGKYSLWVTQAEKDAMAGVLASCPAQQVPADGGVLSPVQVQDEPAAPAEQAEQATPAAPAESDSPAADENVSYKNCAAVRAAGKAPLHRGDPGYAPKLDRDGDGIACE